MKKNRTTMAVGCLKLQRFPALFCEMMSTDRQRQVTGVVDQTRHRDEAWRWAHTVQKLEWVALI